MELFLISVIVSLIVGVFLQFRIDKLEKRIERLETFKKETQLRYRKAR